jgi:hypothetical protein
MKNIKFQNKVRYIGKPNTWTFEQDLNEKCVGTVIKNNHNKGKTCCLVNFENCILTSIDIEDLQEIT